MENKVIAETEDAIIEEGIQEVAASPEDTASSDTIDSGVETKVIEVSKEQQALNKIAFEKREEKRRADTAEARVKELEATQTKAVTEPAMPKESDFDFDDDKYQTALGKYNSDLVDYRVQKALGTQQQQAEKGVEAKTRQEIFTSFEKKVAESGIENFYEVTATLPTFEQPVLDAIMQNENGVKIAHYLSQHQDQADIIAGSNPVIAAMKIGEISQRISSATKTIKTSEAPDPIDPIKQGGAVAGEADDPLTAGATFS